MGEIKEIKFSNNTDVAIIGVACRFPKAKNSQEFWQNLKAGKDCIQEIPSERWKLEKYYSPLHDKPNTSVSKWAGLLENISHFDSKFFKISNIEAKNMDPQQRLLLEETWHCLEDSGVPLTELQRKITSVYVGVMSIDYQQEMAQAETIEKSACLGNYQGILANRLSSFLGLQGESKSLDTACASSLVALHNARQSLLLQESDFAIAAGVSIICNPWKYISFSKSRMLSPDGKCKTFDLDANGYVPGEGVGALLLQPLENALADGNHIYGILKGTAVNHTGHSVSITAPKVKAQQTVIETALKASKVSPESISYIEAHGTGTPLGDPIEMEALNQAFHQVNKKQYCLVGSVKTNIGHLEAAAGIAGVIKVLMMFKYKQIPKSLNIKTLNPILPLKNSPFKIATELLPWTNFENQPRRAGVSSFGFGGVNSHVILEEYPNIVPEKNKNNKAELFVLSAKTNESLKLLIESWKSYINTTPFKTTALRDICHTLIRREAFAYRYGLVVQSHSELCHHLQQFKDVKKIEKVEKIESLQINFRLNLLSNIDFEAFKYLYQNVPCFKENFEYCKGTAAKFFQDPSILTSWSIDAFSKEMQQENVFRFSVSYAFTQFLFSLGLKPDLLYSEQEGMLLVLSSCNVLNLADCFALLTDSPLEITSLKRPVLPFFDSISQQTIFPYRLEQEYFDRIFCEIYCNHNEWHFYSQEAKLLYEKQFTFKKYLDEWQPFLKKYQLELTQLFQNKFEEPLGNPENILMLTIILVALKKLNFKWSLSEPFKIESVALQEFVTLIVDKVLTPEDAILLLSGKRIELEKVNQSFQKQFDFLNIEKDYPLLTAQNKKLVEIEEPSKWLEQVLKKETNQNFTHDFLISLGTKISNEPKREINFNLDLPFPIALNQNLLQLWLAGFSLQWEVFTSGSIFKKTPLPTYPFIGKPFWIQKKSDCIEQEELPSSTLNPLIDLMDSSDKSQIRFTKNFSGNEFYFESHKIAEKKILPAMVSLEMARIAGKLLNESKSIKKIKALTWYRPLFSEEEKETILLFSPQKNEFSFQFTQKTKEENCYAQGSLSYQENPIPKLIEWNHLKKIKSNKIARKEIYQKLQQKGFLYGKEFQGLEWLALGEKEAYGKLNLNFNTPLSEIESFPEFLDSAIQPILFLEFLQDDSSLPLPFSVDEVCFFEKKIQPNKPYYTYVSLNPSKISRKYKVQIFDQEGNVLVGFYGFTIRAKIQNRSVPLSGLPSFYESCWEKKEPLHASQDFPFLLFTEHFTETFSKKASVCVKRGRTYQKKNQNLFEIDITQTEPYQQLILNFKETRPELLKYVAIFWAWEKKDKLSSLGENSKIELLIESELLNLFELLKAFLRYKLKEKVTFLYLYPDSSIGRLLASAVTGFFKSIHQEKPNFLFKVVGIDPQEKTENVYSTLTQEWQNHENFVCYQKKERFVKEYHLVSLSSKKQKESPLKPESVLLISGGLGGLGFLFAEHFAKTIQAKLILIGRSTLDRNKEAKLKTLKKYGSEVLYLSADVTCCSEIEEAIQKGKAAFGPINAVFHCAGILRDSFALKKEVSDFAKVIQPKISGTFYLDFATKEEPLEFFISFSSIVSLLGNTGQCDYSCGNGFLDEFSFYREKLCFENKRSGKTITINWPLWDSEGMSVGKQTIEWLENTFGMQVLNETNGIEALFQILQMDKNQVIVFPGNTTKFEKHLAIEIENNMKKNSFHYDYTQSLTLSLLSHAGVILGVEPEELSPQEELGDYGFDSVGFTELANKLNKQFQFELTPAVFFEYNTIGNLCGYLKEQYTELLETFYSKEKISPPKIHQNAPLSSSISSAPKKELNPSLSEIAIIGIDGRFPQVKNLDDLWSSLVKKESLLGEIPAERWNWQDIYGEPGMNKNQTQIKWGGFMKDVDAFDASFFGISPQEAELMDPQQRIFLEAAWKTIENAGYKVSDYSGTATGLFVGVSTADYSELLQQSNVVEAKSYSGIAKSILANRVSYLLNLKGPSEAIDTACSSSLVAIHQAIRAIQTGDCEQALAGGVNVLLTPTMFISFDQAGMLSKEGRCKTFSQDANGYVRGEGCGVVLLKPLKKALADKDFIYATIKGSAINHGGKANSLTSPNPNSQAELLIDAYQKSGIAPETVSYIETHGTGTSLGDPIEINGLTKAFKELVPAEEKKSFSCGLGSVKTNIGHLEAAAGIAGVLKVILSLQHKTLPGILHFQKLNPYIELAGSPFRLIEETQVWENPFEEQNIPRRAGVSSFGFGGANAHLILEEFSVVDENKEDTSELVLLSAKNKERLDEYGHNLLTFLKENANVSLSNLAYTLQVGRDSFSTRLALFVSSQEELIKKLTSYLNGEKNADYYHQNEISKKNEKPHFLNEEEFFLEMVQKFLQQKNYQKLAKLWIQGFEINWNELGKDKSLAQRIPLPTYPFAKERYWVPVKDKNQEFEETTRSMIPKELFSGDRFVVKQPGKTEEPAVSKTKQLQDYLKKLLAEVLKLPVEKIASQTDFETYGLDSVLILELNRKLEKEFGELPKTLFFEYRNLDEVATFLLEESTGDISFLLPASEENFSTPVYVRSPQPKESGIPHQNRNGEEIAIIGVHGMYPMANNLEEFWENLKAGKDCITEIPKERWDYKKYYQEIDSKLEGKTNSKWGGFLQHFDRFEPLFFNISSREAELMDPQERLFLEVVWNTLEDSGYSRKELADKNVGVFVGAMWSQYQLYSQEREGQSLPTSSFASVANRVSYFFDFQGPSLAIDTMCSSSLSAIHLACDSIRSGSCDYAIAGGVNLTVHPNKYLVLSQGSFTSNDGRCRSFGANGTGYVPGEGVGAIFLKKLDQALHDGDHIYASIKGSALNHGGKTNGYTVPNPKSQEKVIRRAFEKARIAPETISYLETHGTGTSLGDPIEIRGLSSFFNGKDKNFSCAIGSVKSNIGHLEAAAGIAAVTKVLLQMKYKKLVPSLHSQTLNPNINFSQTPFKVQQEFSDWNSPEKDGLLISRRAGISSFGAGGANAHLILEEYFQEVEETIEVSSLNKEEIFLFSAKTEEQLKKLLQEIISFLEKNSGTFSLQDLAYTLKVGREAMEKRLAVTAKYETELKEKLQAFLNESISSYQGCYHLSTLFLEKKDVSPKLLDSWIAERNLPLLAQSWAVGTNIDWEFFYRNEKRRRLSLPAYPFAGKRYWFDSYEQKKKKTNFVSLKKESPSTLLFDSKIFSLKYVDEIAILKIEDRENRNKISAEFVHQLQACFEEIQQQQNVKVIILTGYDDVFCTGGSKETLLAIAERKLKYTDLPFIYEGLLRCELPVISAMQGHSIGAGFILGLYADISILSEEHTFSANFMKYGFTPGVGATFILKEKLGVVLATEMMFTAKTFLGKELKNRGASLIFQPPEKVLSEAIRFAKNLAEKPLHSLKVFKKELAQRILQQLPDVIDKELAMHKETFSQAEVKENIKNRFHKMEQNSVLTMKTKKSLARQLPLVKKASASRLTEEPSANPILSKREISLISIQEEIRSLVAQNLHLEEEEVSSEFSFNEMGVDSISAVEIVRELNQFFSLNLDVVILYDFPNLKKLSERIFTEIKEQEVFHQNIVETVATEKIEETEPQNLIRDILTKLNRGEISLEDAEKSV